jgi:cytochrome b involved in lipid metabolism
MEGYLVAIISVLVLMFSAYLLLGRSTGEIANAKKREYGSFTAAEVARHCTRDDLWLVLRINGGPKVYDVTSYVEEHPGGDAILTNAGGDSTTAFLGPQHPPRVMDLIEEFCIGDLVE